MSKAETSFSFPRPRRELLAPLLALALAGCGASKAEEAPEAVNSGTNVAVEAGATPVPAAATPESTPQASGVSETLQRLCDPAFTYDGMTVEVSTPTSLVETRWMDPGTGITREDVVSELDNASITAGSDVDEEVPVDPDTELPPNTFVSISFIGSCDQ